MPRLSNELLTTTVRAIRREAKQILVFELIQPEDWELPTFTPGAHIDVHIPGGFVRQYSLMSDPADRYVYKVGVALQTDGTGGSLALHQVREGDWLSVSMPKNYFPMAPAARKHVFIAGGIGITPFLSMIPAALRSNTPFELHMCSSMETQTPFLDELAGVPRELLRFYHSRGSSPSRLDVKALLSSLAEDEHVYCCGPKNLMEAVRSAAQCWKDPARAHFERFEKQEVSSGKGNKSCIVTLGQQHRELEVIAGESMLTALKRKGVDIDYGCEAGTCGRCRTRYLSGDIDHRDYFLSDADRKSFMMPCVSSAVSDRVTLDL